MMEAKILCSVSVKMMEIERELMFDYFDILRAYLDLLWAYLFEYVLERMWEYLWV